MKYAFFLDILFKETGAKIYKDKKFRKLMMKRWRNIDRYIVQGWKYTDTVMGVLNRGSVK